jgi:hypothetical protein
VVFEHLLAYLLGIEGIALLRGHIGERDREFVEARLAEARALLTDERLVERIEIGRASTVECYDGGGDLRHAQRAVRLRRAAGPALRRWVTRSTRRRATASPGMLAAADDSAASRNSYARSSTTARSSTELVPPAGGCWPAGHDYAGLLMFFSMKAQLSDGMLMMGGAARWSLLSRTKMVPCPANLTWTQAALPFVKLLTNHPSSSRTEAFSLINAVPSEISRLAAGIETHPRIAYTPH